MLTAESSTLGVSPSIEVSLALLVMHAHARGFAVFG